MLSASLFDEQAFSFTSQIFIDKKPDYYAFSNETKTMTEADVMAMMVGGGTSEKA
jgi:hypothetical protein